MMVYVVKDKLSMRNSKYKRKPNSIGSWAFSFVLLCFFLINDSFAAVSVTTLVQRNQRLPIQSSANDELVGRYLIVNQDQTFFRVFVNFANACKVQHFTQSNLALPIEKVQLKVTDDTSTSIVTLYDRSLTGTDCNSTLVWEPAGPTYDETYIVEVLLDWNDGSSLTSLAGTYSETINLIAVEF